jgi:hypothetical protein
LLHPYSSFNELINNAPNLISTGQSLNFQPISGVNSHYASIIFKANKFSKALINYSSLGLFISSNLDKSPTPNDYFLNEKIYFKLNHKIAYLRSQ